MLADAFSEDAAMRKGLMAAMMGMASGVMAAMMHDCEHCDTYDECSLPTKRPRDGEPS